MRTLDVSGVEIRRGPRLVIDGVSFSALRGEVVAIMGASGTGKTTMLRAIAGLEAIAAGTIDVDGLRLVRGGIPRARLRDLHRSVGCSSSITSSST